MNKFLKKEFNACVSLDVFYFMLENMISRRASRNSVLLLCCVIRSSNYLPRKIMENREALMVLGDLNESN